jgi:methylated-DNA-protein-cysteine methyltransferase-like protein
LRSDGKIAFPAGSEKAEEQRQRLTAESVVVKNYRVNMNEFGWTPDLHTILVELEY